MEIVDFVPLLVLNQTNLVTQTVIATQLKKNRNAIKRRKTLKKNVSRVNFVGIYVSKKL